jgi:hypothetical protein
VMEKQQHSSPNRTTALAVIRGLGRGALGATIASGSPGPALRPTVSATSWPTPAQRTAESPHLAAASAHKGKGRARGNEGRSGSQCARYSPAQRPMNFAVKTAKKSGTRKPSTHGGAPPPPPPAPWHAKSTASGQGTGAKRAARSPTATTTAAPRRAHLSQLSADDAAEAGKEYRECECDVDPTEGGENQCKYGCKRVKSTHPNYAGEVRERELC